MTDMQRYAMTGYDSTDAWLAPDDEGNWVSHADAEAAITAAYVRGRKSYIEEAAADVHSLVLNRSQIIQLGDANYQQGQRDMLAKMLHEVEAAHLAGQRDMLAKCISAVEPLTNKMDHPWATVGDALAALRALEEKP